MGISKVTGDYFRGLIAEPFSICQCVLPLPERIQPDSRLARNAALNFEKVSKVRERHPALRGRAGRLVHLRKDAVAVHETSRAESLSAVQVRHAIAH